MNEERQRFWKWVTRAACGVLGMALAAAAVAAPPLGRGATMSADLHSGDTGGGRLGGSALHANADKISAAKLDLRAPADLVAASTVSGERPEFAADGQAFPSVRGASDDSPRARLEEHLRSLGAEGAAVHPMSRAEQLATRFRREGLPVARLFESHSALISLGLNQRGKPGIWLIQKLP